MTFDFLPITTQFTQMGQLHLAAFTKGWSETTFREMFEDSAQYSGTFILQDEQFLGFIVYSKIIDEAEIITICIAPDQQNKGLGSALLQYQIESLRQTGVKNLFLEVSEFNQNAIGLYKKLGFTSSSIRKKYYKLPNGQHADAHIFALML